MLFSHVEELEHFLGCVRSISVYSWALIHFIPSRNEISSRVEALDTIVSSSTFLKTPSHHKEAKADQVTLDVRRTAAALSREDVIVCSRYTTVTLFTSVKRTGESLECSARLNIGSTCGVLPSDVVGPRGRADSLAGPYTH